MRKKTEAAIDILRNKENGWTTVAKDFKEKFFKIITEHYLCKSYCFYLHLTFLTLSTAHPEDQTFDLEQEKETGWKNGKKVYLATKFDAKNP